VSEWEYVKHVTVPKQASLLNYQLISVTTLQLITFVYNVCALVLLTALHSCFADYIRYVHTQFGSAGQPAVAYHPVPLSVPDNRQ
jgi:hypothetical protein